MRYKLFGHTGLKVSELSLGVMTFGESWGWGSDKAESQSVFDAYVDAGGNFFDTADQYTDGDSERWLGEFCASERERFVITTKYSSAMSTAHPLASGNSRKHMVQALEGSLKRLNTDYVDVYWLHCWDFLTSPEEVMRGLDDLISAGKIQYIGISNTPAWAVAQANTLAELRGWHRFAGLQLKYNLVTRDIEAEYFPMADALDLSVCAWSPLASGVLSGKYNPHNEAATENSARAKVVAGKVAATTYTVVEAITAVAKQCSASVPQVALAWMRQQHHRVIPILGARTLAQLKDNMGCLDVQLSAEQMQRLNDASQWQQPFPQNFLQSADQVGRTYGGFVDLIDNHRG
ncbi:aldo/keto reductase [Oceanicoccus sp. KOV_DT_Chl]|uniref:aldo/keto reductase n=1 Tax=Oceanicoccus sp. KOV_DT_Chl TaxID=1904639 RepID=UPI000C7DB260|nr:aldo/keto reductase [Oceanicoccus sp. KOV_DT_Chl]